METIICEGVITETIDGFAQCSTGWLTQVAVSPFNVGQISPEVATAMFTAGFMIIFTPWAVGFGVQQLVNFVRKS